MSDFSRSCLNDRAPVGLGYYEDNLIPAGTVISGGELKCRDDGLLVGIKFWDKQKKVLLESTSGLYSGNIAH